MTRLPAEWEPHEATWLAWPHEKEDWPGKLESVRWVYVDFVRQLSRCEPVRLLVDSEKAGAQAREMLRLGDVDLTCVELLICPTNRSWLRDSGPTFTTERAICWKFTAWGRYANWRKDRRVARFVAEAAGTPAVEPVRGRQRVILEGGAIDGNGRGTLLTTSECLVDGETARHPERTRAGWEAVFAEYLGVRHTIWLGQGIAGDDTGGHVDDLARFVGPERVVTAVETRRKDENYRPLRKNLSLLKRQTTERGRPLEVIELPMPRALYFDGCRLPASYANFYIANGAVFVPTFNDPNDRIALRVVEAAFPRHDIIPIHSVDMVWGFGTLHCATQQQPKTGLD